MASYATLADVKARAGRVAGSFAVEGKHPTESDVERFLIDVSSLIDAAIRARGFDPATMEATVGEALRDLAAYGALARAMSGVDHPVVAKADAVWTTGIEAIYDGRHAAILQLEAGAGGAGGTSSGTYLSDNPEIVSCPAVTRDQIF